MTMEFSKFLFILTIFSQSLQEKPISKIKFLYNFSVLTFFVDIQTLFYVSLKYHHLQPALNTHKSSWKLFIPVSNFPTFNILTRKAPYSFFVLHHSSRQCREGGTFLRRSFLSTTFIGLYFMHSLASPSSSDASFAPNVIDDSRLSRVCLLNLLSYLFAPLVSPFFIFHSPSSATSLQLRRGLDL